MSKKGMWIGISGLVMLALGPQGGRGQDRSETESYPTSGFKVLGRPAPELRVAEWVKGDPVTLAELKGKVMLLVFWGAHQGAWLGAFPRLEELHQKCARDGLVIIAIHDSTANKAFLLDASRDRLDLSKTSFRVAVDSLPNDTLLARIRGSGQTIDAYGVDIPTFLIVNRDGQVEGAEYTALEDRVSMLLYGRPMRQPTLFSRLLAANPWLFITAGAAVSLMVVLGAVLVARRLRCSGPSAHEC